MEFAYNNSFQASIGMAPFEALYGGRCRSPVCWDDIGEKKLLGPKLVQLTVEKVSLIKERLKAAQSRQNGIRADPRPRCGGLFGSIRGVCLFGPTIPWGTMRTLCLHGGGVFVMSHIG